MATFTFQKPDKVIMIDSTDFEGKFEFRPLEPGYGLTIGNALRRVLFPHLRDLHSHLLKLIMSIMNLLLFLELLKM